ncbi:2-enoate reductase [Sporobacter termitidis DSM 10068]|uniref:2-enoate reductase n=1 Tax=Sporobacter termitidis DSM 10068 TaxID=1123282 RepID=A0A1M5Z3G8_9FIRM|nr:FAD-dependent oxidoreductase [Sporobacter termitidis]SHI18739.1 2-enoate reductase [Sporobacter termitidis DSM 10068]
MAGQYEALFMPMKIGGITVKNRIVLCAMGGTNPIGFDGHFEEKTRAYYLERAKANVGLIIPGVIGVKGMTGGWLYESEALFMGPVKSLMDDIHQYGAKFFMQLGAGFGRVQFMIPGADMRADAFKDVMVAPSDGLPNVWDPAIKHRGLTREEIRQIIDAYGKTAALCKRAGIDGVEIHAVHEGYLLDQFSILNTNHRTDEYGGSLENRLRFATEIIKAVKAACGADYPVSVRYSVASKMRGFNAGALPGENYVEFGRSMEESPAAARILEAAGADMLNADNGSYDSWYWAHPPVYMPMACNLPEVTYIKNFVSIPVVCAGKMNDPDIAARAVESGAVDAVGIARALLADPQWCDKVRDGQLADIRPCIGCHNGCFPISHFKGNPCGFGPMGACAINPVTMREEELALRPASVKKKIAVIGGGIGGMEAARLLTMRGHDVTLYEKSGRLGGVFVAAAAPDFKEHDKALIQWYGRQLKKLGVTVSLNTEITAAQLAGLNADEIIVATGSVPKKLPVPGFDGINTIEAVDYLMGKKQAGNTVAIIGGGLTGCEIAYDLALKGKKAVIVEMQDDILKIMGLSAANSEMLREIVRYYGIDVYTSAALSEIRDNGVLVKMETGAQFIPADSVILSVGYTSYVPFDGDALPGGKVHVLGDAAKVGNLMTVINQAYEVAYRL